MQLRPAKLTDEALIAEIDQYRTDETNFHLWWLGQSGYLLSWKGTRLLIDPYLSDSLTKKYAGTHRPHIRISERVLRPELLRDISVVSSSHNHTDHLDGETLLPLIENNPGIRLIIPEANREFVCDRLHIPLGFPVGLRDGQRVVVGEFSFHGIPAKHNEIERDEKGNCRYMGYVIGFGKWHLYHSGDTLLFDSLTGILRNFSLDLALLPINGNDPARGVAGNLNAQEAAELARDIRARVLIPGHYDLFAFNTADPAALEAAAKRIDQPVVILELGGHFSSAELEQNEHGEK